MPQQLLQELKASLLEDRYSENRQTWAKYLVDNQVNMQDLLCLLDEKHPIAMYFSWVLGDVLVLQPERIFPIIPYCFELRDKMPFPGFKRSIAKMLAVAGVPKDLEGIVVDELFKWILDLKMPVAVKVHSLETIYNLTIKYPELKEELLDVIEDQLDKNSIAFKARAKQVVKKLKKTKN